MALRGSDLFAMANSIAELLQAPVTIEDRDTIVVAYSGGEQAVDEARIGTILSRQVPLHYRQALAAAGVFAQLASSDEVIYVDLPEVRMTPRAVIAVREGSQLLGSIWAAVQGAPTAEQERVLRSAAPAVARLIGQERDRSDESRRERRDLVNRLFAGGDTAIDTAGELGLRGPLTVAAIAGQGIESDVMSSVALHLGALVPRSVGANLGDTTYAVVGADALSARRIFADYLARSRTGSAIMIGLGREVSGPDRVDVSRRDADDILKAMKRKRQYGHVGVMREQLADILSWRSAAFLDAHADASPLTALLAYDAAHDTQLVSAARAFLAAGGDVADAAATIHVHPNTMRNRLRRAERSCGVDLADADTRLVLMMHFKVLDLDA